MLARTLLLSISTMAFCGMLSSQEKDCSEIAAMANIARAQSQTALLRLKNAAGNSYGVQATFAARQFELMPFNKKSAASLLDLIPQNREQKEVWDQMNSSQCDAETERDLSSLAKLKYRLAHDLARAVNLVPEKMQAYVSYAYEAVQDPDDSFAVEMKRVCRRHHAAFARAVELMGGGAERDQFSIPSTNWFREHIFNPDGCRTLAFPEAD